VKTSDRAKYSEKMFMKGLKTMYGFQNLNKDWDWIAPNISDTIFRGKMDTIIVKKPSKLIFKFADQEFTRADFANYIYRKQRNQTKMDVESYLAQKFQKFANKSVYNYEKEQLSYKYLDYKLKTQEFYDGILKFNFMMENIWNKGSEDTVGLKNYYEENQASFVWPKRFEGSLIRLESSEAVAKFNEFLELGLSLDSLKNFMSENGIKGTNINEGKYTVEDLKRYGVTSDIPKGFSAIFNSREAYYIMFTEMVLEPTNQTLDDAKGIIISSYQQYLEKLVIEDLRDRYNVNINSETLKSIAN
jgi:peptidyl-prolyl cis-trans isomerase SurA